MWPLFPRKLGRRAGTHVAGCLDAERKADEDVGGEKEEMRHIVAAAWGPALRAERQNGAANGAV